MSKAEELEYPFCRDAMTVYEKLAKIGQGTFTGKWSREEDRLSISSSGRVWIHMFHANSHFHLISQDM